MKNKAVRTILLVVMLNLFSCLTFAQNKRTIDSLQTALISAKEDTNKVNILIAFVNEYVRSNTSPDSVIGYGNKVLELSNKINYKLGIARGYRGIGLGYKNKFDFQKSYEYFINALKIDEEIGRKDRINQDHFNLDICLQMQKNATLSDEINIALSMFYFAFAFIYFNLFFSDKKNKANFFFSLFCFLAFFLHLETGTINHIDNNLSAKIFSWTKDEIVPLAFYIFICFLHCLVLGVRKKYLRYPLIVVLISMLFCFFSRISSSELKSVFFLIYQIGELAIIVFMMVDGTRVCIFGYKKKLNEIRPIIYGFFIFVLFFIFMVFLRFSGVLTAKIAIIGSLLDIIVPLSVSVALVRKHTNTGKQLEIELINVSALSEKSIQQEKEKQKILETQNEVLEQQVTLRTSEVVLQKNIVEKQKEFIEQKNHEITDSINYAQRIQKSILSPLAEVKAALPNSFILFKPKDIVSGDFYWFTETKGKILIAAADCTGHGVPGAFMSTIGSEKLNEAVKDSNDVSVILNLVNRGMKKVLHQSDKIDSTRDGMDIALCAFNKEMTQAEYAGANRPLWVIRKGKTEIEETKATKVAIGGLTEDEQVFTKHTIDLEKGDTVYLFSDGYADQFSPEDKKLMTRKFKEVILSIQDKAMGEQKEYLGSFIENWKGNMEQTDDILVIGVRV